MNETLQKYCPKCDTTTRHGRITQKNAAGKVVVDVTTCEVCGSRG